MNKKLIKECALFSAVWLILCYSVFAFLIWSPYPQEWSLFGRLLFVLFGLILNGIFLGIYIENKSHEPNKSRKDSYET